MSGDPCTDCKNPCEPPRAEEMIERCAAMLRELGPLDLDEVLAPVAAELRELAEQVKAEYRALQPEELSIA